MQREIYQDLTSWKNDPSRKPLLIRGARQVGKTFIIEQFGEAEFENFVKINFELEHQYKACFESLTPSVILDAISAIGRQDFTPGKTLLFLDEIQDCPRAIMALRYFKENMPELHVIAAGSLLEFTLNKKAFRMPVGRVQSLYLKPLTFLEFCNALGYQQLMRSLASATLKEPPSTAIILAAEKLLREYFIVGGMPEAVSEYKQHQQLSKIHMVQTTLMNTYRNDFGKYATTAQIKYLQRLFEQAPGLIAKNFQYSKVDPDMQARELKVALSLLTDAGLIYQNYASNASGLPLISTINPKKFKLLFLDIGLVQSTQYLDPNLLLNEDLLLMNRGALAEQFVGQELLTHFPRYLAGQLFYWARDKRGSMAEVDYVIHSGDKILPLEVKSGKTGSLRSMHQFMLEKQAPLGIRLSMKPLALKDNILSVPLYMIHELDRLLGEALSKPPIA